MSTLSTFSMLNSPVAALNFLTKRYGGYRESAVLVLPKLDIENPVGPVFYNTTTAHQEVFPYGKLLKSAVRALDGKALITQIQIGSRSQGLGLFSGGRLMIVVGNAYVVGREAIAHEHMNSAQCAFHIVSAITGINDKSLDPIRSPTTKSVILKDEGYGWQIAVR